MHRRDTTLEQLLSATQHTDPLAGLIHRAASLVGGSVLVLNQNGEVTTASGAAPEKLITDWVSRAHPARGAVGCRGAADSDASVDFLGAVGRWTLYKKDLQVDPSIDSCVVAVQRMPADAVRDVSRIEQVLDALGLVIRSVRYLQTYERTLRAAESGRLLKKLILGVQSAHEPIVWQQLEEFGFAPYAAVRVARVHVKGHDASGHISTRAGAGTAVLHEARILGHDRSELTLLFPADFDYQPPAGSRAGVSEPFTSLASVPEMLRSADIARSRATAQRQLVRVDELDPAQWAIARLNARYDESVINRFVQKFADDSAVLDTVRCYFSGPMDISRVAAEMNLHPNSIRYRLAKLEAATGYSINDPKLVASMVIALGAGE